jgi:acyl carrier protein
VDEIATNPAVEIAEVKAVVVETLGIEDRAEALAPTTPLWGSVPELDSMAVLELILELERRFAITISDDDVSADVFETLASIREFVAGRLH